MALGRFPLVAILVLLAAFSYYRYHHHQSSPYLPPVRLSDSFHPDLSVDLSSDGSVREEGSGKGVSVPQREVRFWGLREGLKHETDPIRKLEIESMINDTIQHRLHVDASIRKIAVLLYGPDLGAALLKHPIDHTIQHTSHLYATIHKIAEFLFGPLKGAALLKSAKSHFVDESDRYGPALDLFEKTCGTLDGSVGFLHADQLESIIGAGVSLVEFEKTCKAVCHGFKQKIEPCC